MHHFRDLRRLVAATLLLIVSPLWAGGPVGIDVADATDTLLSPTVGTPVTKTIQLTFDRLSNPAGPNPQAQLDQLMVSGAPQFTIVGGTCVANTTQLNEGNPSCTVIVQYLPTASTTASAQLQFSCNTFGFIGGFTLQCNDPATLASASLIGALFAFAPTPFLDPRLLTLIALVLIGIGIGKIALSARQ